MGREPALNGEHGVPPDVRARTSNATSADKCVTYTDGLIIVNYVYDVTECVNYVYDVN